MKWMPIREFLRGGYKDLKEPTVVTSHGHPIFSVMPHTQHGYRVNGPYPNDKPPTEKP